MDELPKLQLIANKRKKFTKMKTDFIINNIEPYTKFLDEKKKTKKLATKKTDSECDFVD